MSLMATTLLMGVVVLRTLVLVDGYKAYDCSHPVGRTLYSMGTGEDCDQEFSTAYKTNQTVGTVIRMAHETQVSAVECSLERLTKSFYCEYHLDMLSAMTAENYHGFLPVPLQGVACKAWRELGTATYAGMSVALRPGQTQMMSSEAGVSSKGFCETWGTWITVDYYRVRMSSTTVTQIREADGSVSSVKGPTGEIILPEREGVGIDGNGLAYDWSYSAMEACPRRSMYSGIIETISLDGQLTGMLHTSRAIGYRLKGTESLCGTIVKRTNDPYVSVLVGEEIELPPTRVTDGNAVLTIHTANVGFLDMAHTSALDKSASNSMQHICRLEQSLRIDMMSFNNADPAVLALQLFRVPGYTATVAGEVLSVGTCRGVQVKLATLATCHRDVPVLIDGSGTHVFMNPVTKALMAHSPELDCGDEAIPVFFHNHMWGRMMPSFELVQVEDTQSVKQLKRVTPPMSDLEDILPEEEMNKLRELGTYADQTRYSADAVHEFLMARLPGSTMVPMRDAVRAEIHQAAHVHLAVGYTTTALVIILYVIVILGWVCSCRKNPAVVVQQLNGDVPPRSPASREDSVRASLLYSTLQKGTVPDQ